VSYRDEVGEGRQRKRRRGKAKAAKNLEFAAEDVEDVTAVAAAASNGSVATAVGNQRIRWS
jgi:hypothetical protein